MTLSDRIDEAINSTPHNKKAFEDCVTYEQDLFVRQMMIRILKCIKDADPVIIRAILKEKIKKEKLAS
jgi:hypothetical protein